MKSIYSFLAVILSLQIIAQAPPVIEGTYYPVRNTSIKQVWDTTAGYMSIPTIGTNQVWDYRFSNNQFIHVIDTFSFGFYDPNTTPFYNMFPNATHATFVRTPFDYVSDSLYYYWEVKKEGLFNLGGYNIKHNYDSTVTPDKPEFFSPGLIHYQDAILDTVNTTIFANNFYGYRAKIRERKYKNQTYVAYGTLLLPNANYYNVALVKEVSLITDSVFVDMLHNGNYSFLTVQSATNNVYQFLRNNTFGSAFLMYLYANTQNTSVNYAWYTLPVDFGSLSGTVFTDAAETGHVTNGEMYLYREHSNFSKDDILARTNLDANGNFKFDSIPYGEYRIAVRPDQTLYPNTKITYYGDTTNWIDASTIITTTTTSTGHNIHIQSHPAPAGTSTITGVIAEDWSYSRGSQLAASIPVPGVGVVVKKHPGNTAARVLVTDSNGGFDLGNLEDGQYELFVDIPGLYMAGTYNFTVSNGSLLNSLDYTVGQDSIHPTNISAIGLKELSAQAKNMHLVAYPNPFQNQTNIEIDVENAQQIKLELYDISGKLLKVIENKKLSTGKHLYIIADKELNNQEGFYFVKETFENGSSKTIRIIRE